MITILDTNVVSEAMKVHPSEAVTRWFKLQPESSLFTTSVTLAEVLYGIELLSAGKRRSALAQAVVTIFEEVLAGRVLDFDEPAAREFGGVKAGRKRSGKPIEDVDGQIAAIARSRGASIATRNTRDFLNCGVKLIDPWAYSN